MNSLEREFISLINDLITKTLASDQDLGADMLKQACAHLCVTDNAKRVRPLLCLYYAQMLGEFEIGDIVKLGVAAEFIHAASLLHDDVIDDADSRRGKSSVNRLYGNSASVLSGNYLLTLGFELLNNFNREIINQTIKVVKTMTRAAMLEINTRGSVEVSVDNMREIAIGKTGALFSWCGGAVATHANKPEDAHRLWALGAHIGNIFQMADDLKDFDGDNNLKDQCRDICNKEPSLPIILAVQSDPKIKQEFSRAYLSNNLDNQVVSHLAKLVYNSGAIEQTKSLMQREFEILMDNLAIYHGTCGKDNLDLWVSSLTNVKY